MYYQLFRRVDYSRYYTLLVSSAALVATGGRWLGLHGCGATTSVTQPSGQIEHMECYGDSSKLPRVFASFGAGN